MSRNGAAVEFNDGAYEAEAGFTDSLRSLAPEGRMLVVGFTGGEIPTVKVNRLLLKNIEVIGVGWGAFWLRQPEYLREQWAHLLPQLEAGTLNPVLGLRKWDYTARRRPRRPPTAAAIKSMVIQSHLGTPAGTGRVGSARSSHRRLAQSDRSTSAEHRDAAALAARPATRTVVTVDGEIDQAYTDLLTQLST